jgi:selenocysteine-specific elongation factor
MKQVVIGTAGHIDHGKTALVEALTGMNTDHLPAEQERGMTIDLGFAFLSDDITIIDVPGHERFIRNMMAGVTTVDIALVTVAADDGIMPQTKEHLDILKLLGVKSGCIAITKVDLAQDTDWLDLLEEDVRDYVKGSFLAAAPIVRVSTVTGDGVEELRQVLLDLSGDVVEKADRGFFRLFIDRAFAMKGFGTVVTGTVVSGSAATGDELEILPAQMKVKIRGLQSHGNEVASVSLGDRAALNLSGGDKEKIYRGSQVVAKEFMHPSSEIGVMLKVLDRSERSIKHEQRVRVHVGTDEVMGRVYLADKSGKKKLKPGEESAALIRLEKSVAVAVDDPVIIRFYSPAVTIGGGTVIDPAAPMKWKEARQWLTLLKGENEQQRLVLFLGASMKRPLSLKQWAAKWQISCEHLEVLLSGLEVERFGAPDDPFILLCSDSESLAEDYRRVLQTSHKQRLYRKGIPKEELRQQLKLSQTAFNFLTEQLVSDGEVGLAQGLVSLKGFHIELSDKDKELAERVEVKLRRSNLTPPNVSDLASLLEVSFSDLLPILHVLKDQDRVDEVNRDLWYHRDNLVKLEQKVRDFFRSAALLPVNDFKSITHTTRKHAIPLLEYLDEHQITQREGDHRILNS